MNKHRVGIIGASGYGGAGLLFRLLRHPYITLCGVASRQYVGQSLGACWPQLAGLAETLRFEASDQVIANSDIILSAAPHGSMTTELAQAVREGKRVVDLSADFRLKPADFPCWYGSVHPEPEMCAQAVYGLVELHRQEIAEATLIANPGCHTTTANLALAPLAHAELLGSAPIIHSVTGISGAGRSTNPMNLYSEANENVVPYGLAGTHRHTAEIEDTLGRVKAMGRQVTTHGDFTPITVSFNPYRVPMTRGILASAYVTPAQQTDGNALMELYRDFYEGEPLVTVQDTLPQTKAVSGSDRAMVSVRYDERANQIVALCVTDNLSKGAAGQAVHNLNVMVGYPETTQLMLQGVWP